MARTGSGRRLAEGPFWSLQLVLVAGAGLLAVGVVMAVSTTIAAGPDAGGSAIWAQLVKEVEFVAAGLAVFWLGLRLSPRGLRRLAYPALAITVVALLAVLIPGVGVQINGARRWIDLGPVQLQPSEFVKLALLLWGADLLARKQQLGTLKRARHLFVPVVPGAALVALLVMLEPDLGTTITVLLILLGLLWMVGMPTRYLSGIVFMVVAVVAALAVAAPYRLQRLTSFLHPFADARGAGYHTVEGFYALGSGGLFGVGLGAGTSKYGWVPNANTDFVFAIIGEELGLLGSVAVLALFGLLAYAGLRIARRSADPFARLAAGTATVWLCGQAVINVGYVTGLLPVTGIPLPFVSVGGSALLVCCFVLGMLASFARHEGPAVAASRRAGRLGHRPRWQGALLLPIPEPYRPVRPQRTTRMPHRSPGGTRRSDRTALSRGSAGERPRTDCPARRVPSPATGTRGEREQQRRSA